jgi:CRISPR-associated protein Cmr5
MRVHTRSQKLAQAAYARIALHTNSGQKNPDKEYVSFAKKFPALIHTCGLAQAVAFARAKKQANYIADLTEVLRAADHSEMTEKDPLDHHARTQQLTDYLRLSRDAINAASWLKRYVEAATPDDTMEAES